MPMDGSHGSQVWGEENCAIKRNATLCQDIAYTAYLLGENSVNEMQVNWAADILAPACSMLRGRAPLAKRGQLDFWRSAVCLISMS